MFSEIILQLYDHKDNLSKDLLMRYKRDFARTHKCPELPSHIQLLQSYHKLVKNNTIPKTIAIEEVLKKRAVRSQSGIVAVQVLTKPFRCPGACIFCPNDPTMPKSYIKTEPGAMRALLNDFSPYKQVYNRLLSLTLTGHQTDKIEMIVLGGTWDIYPDEYKRAFIAGLYDACNTFEDYFASIEIDESDNKVGTHFAATKEQIEQFMEQRLPQISTSDNLAKTQGINETAANRIIGLTVETRPEYVTDANCQFRRELGVTRIEMGIQSTNNAVLEANKRGHTIEQAQQAVHKLRQYAFKFSLHIMPGLYMSDYDKDIQSFVDFYADPYFKPDEIKLYPTSVIPNTELYDLYKAGTYIPLETKQITQLIEKVFLDIIPPYTRIKRLIRDIPATEIEAGSNVTNLSQLTHAQLQKKLGADTNLRTHLYTRLYQDAHLISKVDEIHTRENNSTYIIPNTELQEQERIAESKTERNFVSLDTRSREIRNKAQRPTNRRDELVGCPDSNPEIINLVIRPYQSSVGQEFFISFEDTEGFLYGFTRLLLPTPEHIITQPGLGPDTALIRELHIYGKLQKIGNSESEATQHKGFGSQLLAIAESISTQANYSRLSIISGIGVRGYYKKLGYEVEGTYVVKGV